MHLHDRAGTLTSIYVYVYIYIYIYIRAEQLIELIDNHEY